jgi:hypothetical protein
MLIVIGFNFSISISVFGLVEVLDNFGLIGLLMSFIGSN